jgi:hypothetical protein
LARLAPIYRRRIVAAVGRALADDTSNGALRLIGILDTAELRRAHQLAVEIRMQREAAMIEQRRPRWRLAVTAFYGRVVGVVQRRISRNT